MQHPNKELLEIPLGVCSGIVSLTLLDAEAREEGERKKEKEKEKEKEKKRKQERKANTTGKTNKT